MKKDRIDNLMIERGFARDKKEALSLIMSGVIYIDNFKVDTVGEKVDVNANIISKSKNKHYVSRGGYKLEKALQEFKIDLTNKNVIDIGSSTGGFTDCSLKHGAANVIALDVGTNQLDYQLRKNEQVYVLENTNIKDLNNIELPFNIDIAVSDVSFISLVHVFNAIDQVGINEMIALIKPQFEVNKDIAEFNNGIVNDKVIHNEVITNLLLKVSKFGYKLHNITYSPVRGGRNGNIEYCAYFSKNESEFNNESIIKCIDEAFEELM